MNGWCFVAAHATHRTGTTSPVIAATPAITIAAAISGLMNIVKRRSRWKGPGCSAPASKLEIDELLGIGRCFQCLIEDRRDNAADCEIVRRPARPKRKQPYVRTKGHEK